MDSIVWHEVKRGFVWWEVFLLLIGFILSAAWLLYAFFYLPELVSAYMSFGQISFWSCFTLAAVILCVITALKLAFLLGKMWEIYQYYKKQIDAMRSEEKIPSA